MNAGGSAGHARYQSGSARTVEPRPDIVPKAIVSGQRGETRGPLQANSAYSENEAIRTESSTDSSRPESMSGDREK